MKQNGPLRGDPSSGEDSSKRRRARTAPRRHRDGTVTCRNDQLCEPAHKGHQAPTGHGPPTYLFQFSLRSRCTAMLAGLRTLSERILLFCVASNTDWKHAAIPAEIVTTMVVKGVIERDTGGHLALTDSGRAGLRAMLPELCHAVPPPLPSRESDPNRRLDASAIALAEKFFPSAFSVSAVSACAVRFAALIQMDASAEYGIGFAARFPWQFYFR
jgi:hypothetical protein